MTVKTGLDLFEQRWPQDLKQAKVGLVVHPASVNHKLQHAAQLFFQSKQCRLTSLFGPQHGIRGETQDNMIEWQGFIDPLTQLPVYSLYSETRKPSAEMLADLDTLVIDLQDIGSRYYTFIWTMELCMQACAEQKKTVVILDRPNPINGEDMEGPVLDVNFHSFVGQRALPIRHAMTLGEIALYLAKNFYPNLDLRIITMEHWQRSMSFAETGLPWVMPSPNMPILDTAYVYPGMCLLEGTCLSEGRGTTRPFEIFGADFINPDQLVTELNSYHLPGIHFRPLFFQPSFQKYAHRLCGGAQLHIYDRKSFRSFKTGVAILKVIRKLYPQEKLWNNPPYEYEKIKLPIDILAGSDKLRLAIDAEHDLSTMENEWNEQCQQFANLREQNLLY